MNKLSGKVVNFQQSKYFSVVEISTTIGNFFCVIVETSQTAPYLKKGRNINILFNVFDILILKNKDINLLNTFECEIVEINKESLLSKIILKAGENIFVSFLITKQLDILNLKVGDKVYCYINPTNIFIEME